MKLIPPKYLEMRIIKIERAVYLTRIRMLVSQFEPSVPQPNKSETSSSGDGEYVHVNSQNSESPTYDPIWPTYQSPDF